MDTNESNASSGPGVPMNRQSQFRSSCTAPGQPIMDSFAWPSTSPNMAPAGDNAVPAARGGSFFPPILGFLPQGIAFPVNSGFVERATPSSCFGGGVMNTNAFSAAESMNPFSGSSEVFLDHRSKDASGCSNRNAEPEIGKAPSSEVDAKKRRRPNEVIGTDQVESASESVHSKDRGVENSPAMTTGKSKGKGSKEVAKPQKEGYIHVRARRGQATNSHSLAERLRREKISDRMKLLQDLVPGCSKVTGKAVMLDEIINYVQSLQRQVEFLSMKLAAVNPRLDLNVEQLLSKDLLRFPGFPSSPSIVFSPEMMHPQLQLSQSGILQGGVPGMANQDMFRRVIQMPLNEKDMHTKPASQMSHTLDGSFDAVAEMAYLSVIGSQDLGISSFQDGFQM